RFACANPPQAVSSHVARYQSHREKRICHSDSVKATGSGRCTLVPTLIGTPWLAPGGDCGKLLSQTIIFCLEPAHAHRQVREGEERDRSSGRDESSRRGGESRNQSHPRLQRIGSFDK